jgi:hypothetical protein
LKIMNSNLKNLLGLWFATGLLNIQKIDWKSPAVLGKANLTQTQENKRLVISEIPQTS